MTSLGNKSGISSMEVKEINMRRLFNYVYENGPVSKQELAYNLSLSIPTINQYIKNYEEADLIIQDGTFESTGGRKAVAYKCNSSHTFGIGVYITHSFIIITILNLIGEEIFSTKINKKFEPTDQYGIEINDLIDDAITKCKIKPSKVCGVGFSIPGIIEKNNGDYTILFSRTLNYKNWSFSAIGKHCKYPYIVDNDAYFGGYGEAWTDNFKNSFAFLHIASGVGGSIIINGKQFLNHNNVTAMFGHMIVQPGGNKCNCGREGCLQTYINTEVLSEKLNITLEQFFEEKKNNKNYQQIFSDYLDYLCIGISNLRLLLGLDVIVAGEIIEHLSPYEDVLLSKLSKLDTFDSKTYFRFATSKRENSSGRGAALEVIAAYIANI